MCAEGVSGDVGVRGSITGQDALWCAFLEFLRLRQLVLENSDGDVRGVITSAC